MQEEIEQKSITLIVNSSKLTGRTLASAFSKVLRYAHNKAKEHKDVKPQGKQSVRDLIAQNQGVESQELADKAAVRQFDRIAKEYGVDYAIRKGVSEKGEHRYIIFFKARDRSAIDQAMNRYIEQWTKQEKKPSFRKLLQALTAQLPGKSKAKDREIVR